MLNAPEYPCPPFADNALYSDYVEVGHIKVYSAKIDPETYLASENNTPVNLDFSPTCKNNTGWILCDGSAVPIILFPRLFQKTGFRYGKAGKNKFRIPDYRGYFLRGTDSGAGRDPDLNKRSNVDKRKDSDVGSVQDHALRVHQHHYKVAIVSSNDPSDKAAAYGNTSKETIEPLTPKEYISRYETRPMNIYTNFLIYAGQIST